MSSPPQSCDLVQGGGLPATAASQALQALPTHLVEEVLLRLDCFSLASSCAVSRGLRAAASSETLWAAQLHREFGLEVNPTSRERQPLPECQSLQLQQPQSQPQPHSEASRRPSGERHSGAAPSSSGHLGHLHRAPGGTAEAAIRDESKAATAATAGAATSGSPAGTETSWEGSLLPKQQDGSAAPEPRPSAPAAGGSAGALFRRLVESPLAQHLLYVRRFHALVAAVASWTVRIRLMNPGVRAQGQGVGEPVVLRSFMCQCRGVALNPQSVWLRFRLPGWIRRPRDAGAGRADQPPWEPGDTCGGSGGVWDGKPYIELTVLAETPLPIRPLGHQACPSAQPGYLRWPVMCSVPFRLPQGDRMRLLQSHVEGLYVWDDDDDDDHDEDEDQEEAEDGLGNGNSNGNEAVRAGGGGGMAARPCPPGPRGPHLAAYLHYDQLLPVTPPELEPEAGLPAYMPLHRPPQSHPGSVQHAVRLGNQRRNHLRKPSPPPPQQQQQQQQQQPPLQVGPPSVPGPDAVLSRSSMAAPEDLPTGGMSCSDTTTPGPAPRPAMFLYLDWSLLPTATTLPTATASAALSAAAVAAASSTGGWVAGCVVRLWLDTPSHLLVSPGTHHGDAAPGLGRVGRSTQCVTGDSRRADIVILKPVSPPPADWPAPTSIELPHPSVTRNKTLSAAGKCEEGEQKKEPAAAAVELAAAWMRAFGPGPSSTCNLDEFTTGADLYPHPTRQTGVVLTAANNYTADDVNNAQRNYGGGNPRSCGTAGGGQAEDARRSATDPRVSQTQIPYAGPAASMAAEANQIADSLVLEGTGVDGGAAAAEAVVPSPPSCSLLRTLRGAETATCLRELCEGPLPLMVDLALLDPEGTVRLGRCGVEMWNGQDGDHEGVAAAGTGGSVSMHFLLDQLPPRLQCLWDNKLELRWGQAAAAAAAAEGAPAAGEEARARGDGAAGRGNGSGGVSDEDQFTLGAANRGSGGGGVQPLGPGPDQPWVRVALQMPLRNYEVLMAQSES